MSKPELPQEDFCEPRGDLTPPELKAICKLCYVAKNKRMANIVECERVERTGMYCRLIENLRSLLATQQKEIEFSRRYVQMFMGERIAFRKDELRKFFDEKADKGSHNFDEFLDFCRINGMEVFE